MQKTLLQYDQAAARCEELFAQKTADYGTAWRILRPSSLTDQIFIKARRIRTIEEAGAQQVDDSVEAEFIGIVNYALMALIQLEQTQEDVAKAYSRQLRLARELMIAKNTDYGEVWREMRISSLTDIILMKLLRIKQIEDNQGKTLVSEGLEGNYRDIANYALFALIRLSETQTN